MVNIHHCGKDPETELVLYIICFSEMVLCSFSLNALCRHGSTSGLSYIDSDIAYLTYHQEFTTFDA